MKTSYEKEYDEFCKLYERAYPNWEGPSISCPACGHDYEYEEDGVKCGCWHCLLLRLRKELNG